MGSELTNRPAVFLACIYHASVAEKYMEESGMLTMTLLTL